MLSKRDAHVSPRRSRKLVAGFLAIGLAAVACGDGDGSSTQGGEDSEAQVAPELNLAYSSQPPSMDPVSTTSAVTRNNAMLIYEPLLVLDAEGEVQPMLASAYELNEDNTVITFTIRDEVSFHNGETMSEDDVVASLERWKEITSIGSDYFSEAEVDSPENGIVTITMPEPLALAPLMLADPAQLPHIMPADLVEAAAEGAEGVPEHVGTGPYQYGDWVTDQHLRFDRFEDYASREEEPNGLAGAKTAYFEEIYVHFVGDSQTRLNGLLTGEYDWIESVPYDNASIIEENEGTDLVAGDGGPAIAVLNKAEGPLSDVNMRQAVIAATETEQALLAGYADGEFFDNNSALMNTGSQWYVEPEAEFENFHQNANIDEAQELMEEAGYNGEAIRILASSDNDDHYNMGVVLQDQLSDAGMDADLMVTDWPTATEINREPGSYEIFITTIANWPMLPATFMFYTSDWPGWTDSAQIDAAAEAFLYAEDDASAMAAMEELQEAHNDYAPIMKFGDRIAIYGIDSAFTDFMHVPGVGPVLHNLRPTE